MAYSNYVDTSGLSYCGQEASEIFAKDVYSLDLRGAGVTLLDGVKAKRKIYLGKMDDMFQAYSCTFTPDGQVSLSEDFIEPVAIKVNKEFCRQEFFDSYLVEQTSMTLAGGIPQSFADWYFVRLRETMAKEYADIAWNGDTGRTGTAKAYLKVTDGWVKRINDASGSTKLNGTTFTIDNILSQVEATIKKGLEIAAANETPTDNYKVMMNAADVKLLEMAIGKICCNPISGFNNYVNQNGRIFIFGFEVLPTMQGRNVIIFGDPRNLVLGFDTYDSHLSYKIIYMMDTTLDDVYRIAAITNIAIGVVFPETFVISQP